MFFVQFVCSGLKKYTKASCLIKKLNLHFLALENLKKCDILYCCEKLQQDD